MAVLTITEVGEATGLASSALRFYERHRVIEPIGRAGGKRIYDEGVINRLALVDIYQQAGFTVAEIAELLAADGPETWRALAKAKLVELEERIAVASSAKLLLEHTLRCPDPTLTGCGKFRRSVEVHADCFRSRSRPPRPVVGAASPAGRDGKRRRRS
jgi:DNA-binding transcriptional MerR regulator